MSADGHRQHRILSRPCPLAIRAPLQILGPVSSTSGAVVAERLGHADPSINLRLYAHVIRTHTEGIADVFASTVAEPDDGDDDDDDDGSAGVPAVPC